jgi:hypothetical protein
VTGHQVCILCRMPCGQVVVRRAGGDPGDTGPSRLTSDTILRKTAGVESSLAPNCGNRPTGINPSDRSRDGTVPHSPTTGGRPADRCAQPLLTGRRYLTHPVSVERRKIREGCVRECDKRPVGRGSGDSSCIPRLTTRALRHRERFHLAL